MADIDEIEISQSSKTQDQKQGAHLGPGGVAG